MKQITRSLNALLKNLNALSQKTEKMIASLEKLDKAPAKAGPAKKKPAAPKKVAGKRGAPKKGKAPSATETVLKIIQRSKRGVDTAMLQKKTGYNTRKIWDIVHRAYKEGKIEKVGRGAYIKKV